MNAFDAAKNRFREQYGSEQAEPPRPLMRPTEPATPFPVESLGPVLERATLAIYDRVQAPLAICGTSVLAAAALAVQAHADVVLPTGQSRPLTLFFATIAASGERKSSVDREAVAAVEEREHELRQEHGMLEAGYEIALAAWKAERQSILTDKKLKGAGRREDELNKLGPAPAAPLLPMLTATEPTYEGLCRLFAVGQPSIGLFSAEGGQFIGGHAMSEDHKIKTAAGLSSLWDSGTIRRLRAGDGALVLHGRRLSAHLMVQEKVANLLLADELLQDQGLLSRFLVTAPGSAALSWATGGPCCISAARCRQLDRLRQCLEA